jgi:hypothetical protein
MAVAVKKFVRPERIFFFFFFFFRFQSSIYYKKSQTLGERGGRGDHGEEDSGELHGILGKNSAFF